jgi:hypothetical protein
VDIRLQKLRPIAALSHHAPPLRASSRSPARATAHARCARAQQQKLAGSAPILCKANSSSCSAFDHFADPRPISANDRPRRFAAATTCHVFKSLRVQRRLVIADRAPLVDAKALGRPFFPPAPPRVCNKAWSARTSLTSFSTQRRTRSAISFARASSNCAIVNPQIPQFCHSSEIPDFRSS